MFSFFKKKPVLPASPPEPAVPPAAPAPQLPPAAGAAVPDAVPQPADVHPPAAVAFDTPAPPPAEPLPAPAALPLPTPLGRSALPEERPAAPAPQAPPEPAAPLAHPGTSSLGAPSAAATPSGARSWLRNPFARTEAAPEPAPAPVAAPAAPESKQPTLPVPVPAPAPAPAAAVAEPVAPDSTPAARKNWMDRLRGGLRKTSSSIATVFTGTRIDDALYEELEDALLMADTGVKATQHLLTDLKRRVKDTRTTDPAAVKGLLADALTELLRPLEKPLVIGEFTPTVIMVAGVNGAGKTTSIGKLTRHLAQSGASVLLAAADTFRAAAREQLGVWADRNTVEIISQEGGDPAAVSYDAVTAGRARRKDVVLIDTAGRLPTQLHLMEELRKIKRTIVKAGNAPGAPGMGEPPHEILLVIDGNTGQNALAQVRSFDDALGLTGLIVTKLDGTAKGGVLAAIAQERPLPVYFIGVGEKLEDLETFSAREFAQALLT